MLDDVLGDLHVASLVDEDPLAGGVLHGEPGDRGAGGGDVDADVLPGRVDHRAGVALQGDGLRDLTLSANVPAHTCTVSPFDARWIAVLTER